MVKPNRFLYKAKIKFLYLFFKFQNGLKLDRYLIKRIWIENKKSLNHWNQFNKTRSLSDFDNKLLENVNNKIFYQKDFFLMRKILIPKIYINKEFRLLDF